MRILVHKTPINIIDPNEGIKQVESWARRRESKVINFCNVHSIVTASESSEFANALDSGDLNFPDGGPIAAWIQKKYKVVQNRISGPDFMIDYLEASRGRREKIYLYGNTESVLMKLMHKIKKDYPWVEVVGTYSPPFVELDAISQENEAWISEVNRSGVNTFWVSLGCPKQELWMALHKNKINCPLLGVGAAFPFIAGEISRAPRWMRENSLEWIFRLYCEPRRLFSRYFYTNLKFLAFFFAGRL